MTLTYCANTNSIISNNDTVKGDFLTCPLMSARFCIPMEYLTFKRKLILMLHKFLISLSFYKKYM